MVPCALALALWSDLRFVEYRSWAVAVCGFAVLWAVSLSMRDTQLRVAKEVTVTL